MGQLSLGKSQPEQAAAEEAEVESWGELGGQGPGGGSREKAVGAAGVLRAGEVKGQHMH